MMSSRFDRRTIADQPIDDVDVVRHREDLSGRRQRGPGHDLHLNVVEQSAQSKALEPADSENLYVTGQERCRLSSWTKMERNKVAALALRGR